jgi:ElaB/YqjD/DUF883 family membrane-anchored ribosome-binding protein
VENNVTAPADKTPEQIQAEMAQTRESLTEKVSALENQVVGTVQTAADTLSGTVESVKSLFTTAPGAVSDTVRQAADVVGEKMKQVLDISGHVRAHPWASVGISALAGCITSWLISRDRSPESYAAPAISPAAYTPPAPASKPGVLDDLFSMIGRKIREAAENVIDTASNAVNTTVREKVPTLVDAAAQRLTPDSAAPADPARFRGAESSHW